MNDRIEFILQIILRLKDEASSKLAAFRSELKALNTDAKKTTAGFDAMNSSITSMTRRLGNLQNRLNEVKSTVRQMGDDDDFDKMAAGVDKVADKLRGLSGKRKVVVEIEEQVTGGRTVPPSGRRRREAEAREAERRARAGIEEPDPTAAPVPRPELRKVSLDQFRIIETTNRERQRQVLIIRDETSELIATRKTRRAAENEIARLARKLHEAQELEAQQAETAARAAEEETDVAKEAAAEAKRAARRARDAARRKQAAEDKAAAASEEEAETIKKTSTAKKKTADVELERLPEVEKEIDGLKKLNTAQRAFADALEGEIVKIKFSTDSLGREIVTIINRINEGTEQISRRLTEAGEEIKGSEIRSRIDPTLRRPSIGGGAIGDAGDFDDFEEQFRDFVHELGDIRPKLEDELRRLRNMFRQEVSLFEAQIQRDTASMDDMLQAEQLRREAQAARFAASSAETEFRRQGLGAAPLGSQSEEVRAMRQMADRLEREAEILEHGIERLLERIEDNTRALDEAKETRRGLAGADPLLQGAELHALLAEMDQQMNNMLEEEIQANHRLSEIKEVMDREFAIEGEMADEWNRLVDEFEVLSKNIDEVIRRQQTVRETISGSGIDPTLDFHIEDLTKWVEQDVLALEEHAAVIRATREAEVRERFSPDQAIRLVTASREDINKLKLAIEDMAEAVQTGQLGGEPGDEEERAFVREMFRLETLAERLELGESGLVQRLQELKQTLQIMEEAQRADRPAGATDEQIESLRQERRELFGENHEIVERLQEEFEEGLITHEELIEAILSLDGDIDDLGEEISRLTGASAHPERDFAMANLTEEIRRLENALREQRVAQIERGLFGGGLPPVAGGAVGGQEPKGGGGGGKEPPKKSTAEQFAEDDFERRFTREQNKIASLKIEFSQLEDQLMHTFREFREGGRDVDNLFFMFEKVRKEMEKIAKSAPVTFSRDAADKFFVKTKQIRDEFEQLSKLRDIFGDEEEFRTVVRVFNQIRVAIDDVDTALKVSRGGMQIFRRESERMLELGIGGLAAEMEETQGKFGELETRQTVLARKGQELTRTQEREMQRLGSRIAAQREVLRQLLAEELRARQAETAFVAPSRAAAPSAAKQEEVDEARLAQMRRERERETEQLRANVRKALADEAKAKSDAQKKEAEDARKAAAAELAAHQDRVEKQLAADEKARQKRADEREKERLAAETQTQKVIDDILNTIAAEEQEAERVAFLVDQFQRLEQQTNAGGLSAREAQVQYARLTSEFSKISKNAEVGSQRMVDFGVLAQRAGNRAKRAIEEMKDEVGGTDNLLTQAANGINRLGNRLNRLGANVSKIDNQLRGLAVLGIIVFAQQLLTALVGLGGALVAVGSSAVFAAGALGGTLVAGIAQALPMVGLLVAALSQVGAVTDALNQADLVKQQQAGRADDDTRRQADSADRLSGAQDNLADAQDRLTEARKEARANLEDLIQAERDAELAARGAALSQEEAQQRLQETVRGGSLLELQRAELGVLEAGQGRIRAQADLRGARRDLAAGRDIEGTPEVVAAKKQIEDAQKGLKQAKADAGEAADATFAAADKLQFLLAQLSPAQLRLFHALQRIRNDFKEVFTPITDIIIDSFVRGVNTADQILKSAIFLRTARDMAEELSGAFDRIRIHFFEDPQRLRQGFDIIREGTDNIRPLSRIFTNVGDALLNIAQEAGPAFDIIIDWFSDLSRDIRGITENHDEMEDFFELASDHAVAWLDLVKNVGIFFAVLAGQGQAEGMSLLEDFNQSVVNATEWLRDHEEEVRRFFSQVGDVTRVVADLVVDIAKAVLEVFDPERFEHLVIFIEQTLLPALVILVKGVGGVVDAFLQFLDLPLVGFLAKWGIVILLTSAVFTGIASAVVFLALQFGHFLTILSRVFTIFGRFTPGLSKIVGLIGTLAGKVPLLRPLAGFLEKAALALAGGAIAKRGGTLVDDVLDIAGGPGATTGSGRRVTTQRRTGILGKLGLRKVVIDEADDVAKAAGEVATKGGTRFGTGFLNVSKGLLKGSAWTAVGIGVVEGVFKGIQTGNIESGIRQFGASISFGIIDSVDEIADKAIENLTTRLSSGKPIPLPITEERLFEQPDFTAPGVMPKLPDLSQQEKDAAALFGWLDKIRDANPDMADAAETLIDLFRRMADARKEKAGEGIFKGMIDEARAIGERFPELLPIIDKVVDGIQTKMEEVDKILKPREIAVKFSFDILKFKDQPREFKKAIDDLIAETDKLPPAGRRAAKNTIDGMVSQFVERGDLTVDEALNIRLKINKQWDKATEDARKKSRQTAKAASDNLVLAQKVVGAGQAEMGEDAAAIFNAVSLGRVRAAPLTKEAARIRQKWTSFDPLANFRASGGVIGMQGESGHDLIPAMLGRGEMVFNKFHQRYIDPAVQWFYGHGLGDVFKRIRGYHAGGPSGPFGFSGGYAGKTPSGNVSVPIPSQYTAGTPEFIAQNVLRAAISLLRGYKMTVTDAFATAGHDGAGHLQTGTAMDTVPDFGIGGSWATVNKAVAAATRRGMTVLYDGRFGSTPWPDHGEGHHAHFELGSVMSKLFSGPDAPKLAKLIYNWPLEGVHKGIGQGIFDSTRRVANAAIDRLAKRYEIPVGDTPTDSDAGIGEAAAKRIFRQAFQIHQRVTGVRTLPTWLSNLTWLAGKESTWDPSARNLTAAGAAAGYPEGILQVTRGTFGAYHLPGYDNPFNALHNALASIRYQLSRYGTLVHFSPYAKGGEIPGHEGQPFPILAHGKEWVLNLAQQAQVAAMAGVSRESLKSMLGFHGGRGSFQGGGDTGDSIKAQERRLNFSFSTEAEIDRIRNMLRGIFRLPAIPVRAWKDVIDQAQDALDTIAVAGQRVGRRLRDLHRELRKLKRGGVSESEKDDVKKLNEEIQRLEKLAPVRRHLARVRERIRDIRGTISDIREGGVTRREQPRLRALREDLGEQREQLPALERREAKLAKPDRGRFIRSVDVITKEGGVLDQMDEARERVADRLQRGLQRLTRRLRRAAGAKIEDVAVAVANKELGNIQTELSNLTSEKGVIGETLGRVNNRLAQLRKGGVKKGEAAEVRRLTQQQNNLQNRLGEIQNDIADAQQRFYEAQIAAQQAVVDAINTRASDREFALGIRERVAELFGNTDGLRQIATERIQSMTTQMGELQGQLAGARALGNLELAKEIEQKVADLQTSITEAVAKQFTDAIDVINNQASRSLGRLDLAERLATARGVVGIEGTAAGGGLSRGQIFEQRGRVQEQQRVDLQGVLRGVQATTPQNLKLIQDLTDQLAELDVTIAENTKAYFDARVEDLNSRTGFTLGILGLRQRIFELTGEISQTDTADQVKQLLQERGNILNAQRAGLQALLGEAEAVGNAEAINDLTQQLLENEIATLENTLAIDKLVNKDNLQQFSSSAWTQFRQAIFDGMGGLLPKYAINVPSAQAGARIMQGGLVMAHPGEIIVPARVARGHFGAGSAEYNTEVHLTSPTEVADPVILGNAIGWRIANNPNLRP